MDDVCLQVDGNVSHEYFSSYMKQLNDQKHLLTIYYTKNKKSYKTFIYIFGKRCKDKKNFCALMCIIQNILQYYMKDTTNVNPLKPKVMKHACTWKKTFN